MQSDWVRQSGTWRQAHCCSGRRVRRPAPAAPAACGAAAPTIRSYFRARRRTGRRAVAIPGRRRRCIARPADHETAGWISRVRSRRHHERDSSPASAAIQEAESLLTTGATAGLLLQLLGRRTRSPRGVSVEIPDWSVGGRWSHCRRSSGDNRVHTDSSRARRAGLAESSSILDQYTQTGKRQALYIPTHIHTSGRSDRRQSRWQQLQSFPTY